MLLTVIFKNLILTTLFYTTAYNYLIIRFFLRKYADTDMGTDKQGVVVQDQIKVLTKIKRQKNLWVQVKIQRPWLVEKHTILIRNQWIWHFWSVSGGILVVRKEDSVENNFNKGMLNVKNLTFQPQHNYYNQGDVIYGGIFTENSSLESTSLE